jgi:hypothetical protein
LTIPAGYTGASVVLAAGVYAWPSLGRLPIDGATPQLPDNRLLLVELPLDP